MGAPWSMVPRTVRWRAMEEHGSTDWCATGIFISIYDCVTYCRSLIWNSEWPDCHLRRTIIGISFFPSGDRLLISDSSSLWKKKTSWEQIGFLVRLSLCAKPLAYSFLSFFFSLRDRMFSTFIAFYLELDEEVEDVERTFQSLAPCIRHWTFHSLT